MTATSATGSAVSAGGVTGRLPAAKRARLAATPGGNLEKSGAASAGAGARGNGGGALAAMGTGPLCCWDVCCIECGGGWSGGSAPFGNGIARASASANGCLTCGGGT